MVSRLCPLAALWGGRCRFVISQMYALARVRRGVSSGPVGGTRAAVAELYR